MVYKSRHQPDAPFSYRLGPGRDGDSVKSKSYQEAALEMMDIVRTMEKGCDNLGNDYAGINDQDQIGEYSIHAFYSLLFCLLSHRLLLDLYFLNSVYARPNLTVGPWNFYSWLEQSIKFILNYPLRQTLNVDGQGKRQNSGYPRS